MRILKAISIFCVVLTITSCTNNKTISNGEFKEIITQKYENFKTAMEQQDSDFFKNLYSDQSVFYHLNSKTIGNTNIAKDFKSAIDAGIVISCTPIDVEVYNNTAFEIGNAIITKNKQEIAKERYIVIWKKENDDWKIDKDIPLKTK